MIQVKNAAQIAMMRDAGKITGEALQMAGEMVRPGVTTKEIDTAIRSYITKCGATPSFLNYNGFPAVPASASMTKSFTAFRQRRKFSKTVIS